MPSANLSQECVTPAPQRYATRSRSAQKSPGYSTLKRGKSLRVRKQTPKRLKTPAKKGPKGMNNYSATKNGDLSLISVDSLEPISEVICDYDSILRKMEGLNLRSQAKLINLELFRQIMDTKLKDNPQLQHDMSMIVKKLESLFVSEEESFVSSIKEAKRQRYKPNPLNEQRLKEIEEIDQHVHPFKDIQDMEDTLKDELAERKQKCNYHQEMKLQFQSQIRAEHQRLNQVAFWSESDSDSESD